MLITLRAKRVKIEKETGPSSLSQRLPGLLLGKGKKLANS